MVNKTTRSITPTQRAMAYLEECIRQCHNGTPLPSINTACLALSVSRTTMIRAVRHLAEQRRLIIVPGKGLFLPDDKDAAVSLISSEAKSRMLPTHAWVRIREQLTSDIRCRRFKRGEPLPSAKTLCATYGTAFRTLQKALSSLESGNILTRRKRTYVVMPVERNSSAGRIVVISISSKTSHLVSLTDRMPVILSALETECTNYDVGLEIRHAGQQLGDPITEVNPRYDQSLDTGGDPASILGYIILTVGYDLDRFRELLRVLVPEGKPVAVLDEMKIGMYPSLCRIHPLIRIFPVGHDKEAGACMARYLYGLGHTAIAYFSPCMNDHVMDARFGGMDRFYRDAGLPGAVTRFTAEEFQDEQALRWIVLHSESHERISQAMARTIHGYTPPETAGETGPLQEPFVRGTIRKIMNPLFDSALAQGKCTAWVAYNDRVASLMLEFLNGRGIGVPRKISVAGFDDSMEAFSSGLTSYSFNAPAVVSAMVDFILSPRGHGAWSGGTAQVMEIPGRVMARATTRGV